MLRRCPLLAMTAQLAQRHFAQQRRRDQAVKRHDGREINPAEPIMRLHQGGQGDLLRRNGAGSRDVDDDAKIQMLVVEARDQPVRRLAQDRKQADRFARRVFGPCPDVLRPNGATSMLRRRTSVSTQRGERAIISSAALRASRHALRRRCGRRRRIARRHSSGLGVTMGVTSWTVMRRQPASPADGNARPEAWHRPRCRRTARSRRRSRRTRPRTPAPRPPGSRSASS